ncbi:N-6 DNA methylase [Salinigranum marinum]|uniref:N-6 DNA methylase n=1 Tax=Salinigranum marinum TaxID=1515595 RepID=UPI002989B903|nr:N-6 DNA methylase [Salinigranum marinum]
MFTNRNYGDFRALYRLCHASRFIEPVFEDDEEDAIETPLEQLYQVALSTGVKVGQDLQDNVVSALETLGNGFLTSEIETALEEGGQDAAEDYYQDLLYVVYRLLFLMFAEQRGMMSQRDSLYTTEYSVTKLRERAEKRDQNDRNTDIWEGLKATFELVGEGDRVLGVPGYNGDLFDDENIEYILDAECANKSLLSAVYDLTHIEQDGYRQRISYADLGVEEIGAVYESLLEFTPQLAETVIQLDDRTISPDSFYLDDRGMDRKGTGSYYTDPGLVDELIQSSLKPVVEDRVDEDASSKVQKQQLLDITVCDPACGSGAFLIAANNFLGQKLAEIQSDSLYPDERTIRQARRSVVQHCLYGGCHRRVLTP